MPQWGAAKMTCGLQVLPLVETGGPWTPIDSSNPDHKVIDFVVISSCGVLQSEVEPSMTAVRTLYKDQPYSKWLAPPRPFEIPV